MGRRTYETMRERGMSPKSMGMKAVVVSTTLVPEQHRDVTVVASHVAEMLAALKAEPGKDIWLCGGGVLFRYLLDAELVDGIDIAVVPVLLSSGVQLLPEGQRCTLKLIESKSAAQRDRHAKVRRDAWDGSSLKEAVPNPLEPVDRSDTRACVKT
jgi:dihydrofolate reductase